MAISDAQYNKARGILIDAGSTTAAKSHPKHNTRGGSPINHGQSLIQEARDEFRIMDAGQGVRSGMTQPHYDAIHDAAREMGVMNW